MEECITILKERQTLFAHRYVQLLVVTLCIFLALINVSLYLRFRETQTKIPPLGLGQWDVFQQRMTERMADPAWRLQRLERLLHQRIDAIFAPPQRDRLRDLALPSWQGSDVLWPFAASSVLDPVAQLAELDAALAPL